MDYRISVRMERRYGPKTRFKLLSKATSSPVLEDDGVEDHDALWDLFNEIAKTVREHKGHR